MTLLPALRRDGEDYATLEDLLRCDDLPAADVRVPFWGKDGRPLLLRVRALSFTQQEAVNRAARVAAVRLAREDTATLQAGTPWQALLPPSGRDLKTTVLGTIKHGIVAPAMTDAQVLALADKNPHAAEQLAAFIQTLGALTAEGIDAIVAELVADEERAGGAPGEDPGDGD